MTSPSRRGIAPMGVAHVSCLARQAKIAVEEAEENNLDAGLYDARWARWHTCGLCEQEYHGVVNCALGWACWKTYLGRSEVNSTRTLRARETLHVETGPFKVGDKVDARFRGWRTFYSGTIDKVHSTSLYDVAYDAGYTETNVSSKFIRRRR